MKDGFPKHLHHHDHHVEERTSNFDAIFSNHSGCPPIVVDKSQLSKVASLFHLEEEEDQPSST